jgi:hypothetical protein
MRRAAVAALLVLSLVAGVVPAAAQDDVLTRDAEVIVEQPHYIGSDVETKQVNGTRTYVASGRVLELHAQNFDSGAVVDYGVATTGGQLTYDSATGQFAFRANASGTYRVYWVVAEQVAVTGGNTTGNATAANTTSGGTETRQVRYTANVRVSNTAPKAHLAESELAETRAEAANWREFNATVQDLRDENLLLASADLSTEETIQGMVNAYILQNDPLRALTGNITTVVLILFTTLGGGFLLVVSLGYHTVVVNKFRRALNRAESIEAEEGELADRVADMNRRDRLRAFQNWDWNDPFEDDHIAHAHRTLGETPLEGFSRFTGTLLQPRVWMHDRLQAMGADGYVAVPESDTSGGTVFTDGGEPEDDAPDAPNWKTIDEAEVVLEDAVDEGTLTDDLSEPSDALLDAIDWQQPAIRDFDLVDATPPGGDGHPTATTLDIDELTAEADLDMAHFDSREEAGVYLRQWFESVREHDFTETDGTVDTSRYVLNRWLQTAQLARDEFDLPVDYMIEAIEAAIDWSDPEESAANTVERIRAGNGGD